MRELTLKYGCNPNQSPARLSMASGAELPLQVLNGRPGYINFLDALNAWQLEAQLKIGIDQHRQLTDQHQPLIRDATEEPDRLVREPIKDFQEIRQLMTLDTAISKHAEYHFERPLSMAALVPRTPNATRRPGAEMTTQVVRKGFCHSRSDCADTQTSLRISHSNISKCRANGQLAVKFLPGWPANWRCRV